MGKDSKEFVMLKFRSMTVNAPMIVNKDGSTYNADDDPRVTKVGHFLRKTSIDELAQLLNVFVGQMSLVGPRASGWDAKGTFLEDEVDKMKVRPGITGFTQAYFRNSVSPRVKRVWDAWYAHNVTMWMDIRSCLRQWLRCLRKRICIPRRAQRIRVHWQNRRRQRKRYDDEEKTIDFGDEYRNERNY